ncbi:hypothetical protein [Embleya hyalina]|uniref:Lipoprotein n=1 Tax=Embleya hyalina TaxID=516124 RepID=A0A401YHI0_9ACTN|nr:hypothetical protein [Embleya hyalina]GCD94062.1 hypothetical protein EHYA_01718 [Embleya hyalina]
MQRITRHATTAALAAALLLATGCSSDGDDDKRATTADPGGRLPAGAPTAPPASQAAAATDTAPLEAAVRTYTAKMFTGDAASAYAILSTRCQGKTTTTEYGAVVAQAKKVYGALTVKSIKVDEMNGDRARVTYSVGVPTLDRTAQTWTREAGTWRWDGC